MALPSEIGTNFHFVTSLFSALYHFAICSPGRLVSTQLSNVNDNLCTGQDLTRKVQHRRNQSPALAPCRCLRFYIRCHHGAQPERLLPLRILLVKKARWHPHPKVGLNFISWQGCLVHCTTSLYVALIACYPLSHPASMKTLAQSRTWLGRFSFKRITT